MKALFFDGSLHFLDNYPEPRPAEGEALIRVLTAGICGTDLEVTRGYRGFRGIPGHEFVGVVERVNQAAQDLVGRRVVGEINCGCGTCPSCMGGLERHCPHRAALGIEGRQGVFAEYVTLPVRNLHPVPSGLGDQQAVFAEPLAAAFEVLEQVHVKPDRSVLVLGDGKLGLLVALVVALSGARTVVAGKHEPNLALVAAQHITTKHVTDLRERNCYDIVVEATGSADGFEAAARLVKPRGTIVLKSTVAEGREMNLSRLVVDEITVVGSRCGPFAPALAGLASGRIDVTPFVSAVYPLEEGVAAFRRAEEKGTLKVLLDLQRGQ